MKKVLLIILLLLVVLGIAAGVGVWKVRHLADSKLLIKEETIFTLKPGTGRLALGEQLYADKIINRPRVFQWLLRIEPDLSHFKAGTYRFTPQMTVREMLKLLESGKEAALGGGEGCAVPGSVHGAEDAPCRGIGVSVGGVVYLHRVGQQAYGDGCHTRHRRNGFFHMACAGRAAHAGDFVALHGDTPFLVVQRKPSPRGGRWRGAPDEGRADGCCP